jgi:SPP1 family predicted phage head-tail adaptor
MKYNKNEVTGKMRDRIILQNVNRSRSLTGFASESWADTATIWAFAESKLPGSNETIIDGKNTAKNVCDFTIRYISTITEESRVVWGDKLYQVKNLKVSHDRRFISFQGVFYDSYILTGVNVAASVNGIGTTSANLKLIMSVIGQANASASTFATITKIIEVSSLVNANASLSGDINFVQKAQASLLATGTTTADLTVNAAGLLLDLYPDAAVAYSLRKLRTAYTGSAVRVRRSSDNTEQDIGFVADELDTVSLLAFCGVGNGFVTTWYDQSGNANNATQTTQANQPQIVSSGVVVLENGKPAILNTATKGFKTSVINFSSFNNLSFFTIQKTQPNTEQLIFETSINYNFNSGAIIGAVTLTNYELGKRSVSYIFNNYTPIVNSRTLYNMYYNNLTGVNMSEMYVNNIIRTEVNSINSSTVNFTNQILSLFSRNGSSIGVIGSYQEFVFYGFDQSSNQSAINTNINTHYAIY